MIDAFSSVTQFNWDEVLEQSIGFFFNVLSYVREKNRREQERIRRFRQTGKWN